MIRPNTNTNIVNISEVEDRIDKLMNDDGFSSVTLQWHAYGGVEESLNYCPDYGCRFATIPMDKENAEKIGKDFARAGYHVYLCRISHVYNGATHVKICKSADNYLETQSRNLYRKY